MKQGDQFEDGLAAQMAKLIRKHNDQQINAHRRMESVEQSGCMQRQNILHAHANAFVQGWKLHN